jgi:ElaA protein
MMKYSFFVKTFEELSNEELYEILRLRSTVFVVEQNCVYQDMDRLDYESMHLFAIDSDDRKIAAYCRLLKKGLSYESHCSIGRVITHADVRATGLGKILMSEAIQKCSSLFPDEPIKISAQCYLLRFYKSFGFAETGDIYLEDGIPHIAMIRHNSV